MLVGNAGGNRRKPFADTTDADWAEIAELNVFSHLRIAREAIALLEQDGGGSMLFNASIFGREAGGPGLSIYNTTKSALISAAKIMALELAPRGIRVNTIAPGSIRFPGGSWDTRVQADPEGMKAFVAQNIPLGTLRDGGGSGPRGRVPVVARCEPHHRRVRQRRRRPVTQPDLRAEAMGAE